MSRFAITGGTGFVGGHFLRVALAAGHRITALTRRTQEEREGVDWVRGDLDDREALELLCSDADAVVHIAGAISAPDRAGFAHTNIDGTKHMIAAAESANVCRFLHISTLAAREPDISDYGWSKAKSESVVRTSGLDWTIIRPPAVYGPGDRETLELFLMAARGRVVLPPPGRLSVIQVYDLVSLFLACTENDATIGSLFEPDDGRTGGMTHREFGEALGNAVGRDVKTMTMPAALVRLGARLDRLFRGKNAKLTPDRARYFCHPDWVSATDLKPDPKIWTPQVALEPGLKTTADWYRDEGWLG